MAAAQAEVAAFGLSMQKPRKTVMCNGVVVCEWGVTAISLQDALFARRLVQDEFTLCRRALELVGASIAAAISGFDDAQELFKALPKSETALGGASVDATTTAGSAAMLGETLVTFFGAVLARYMQLWGTRVAKRSRAYHIAIADEADASVTRRMNIANRRFTITKRRRHIADHTLALLSDSSDDEATEALKQRRERESIRGSFIRWQSYAVRRRYARIANARMALIEGPEVIAPIAEESAPTSTPTTVESNAGIQALIPQLVIQDVGDAQDIPIVLSPSSLRLLERRTIGMS